MISAKYVRKPFSVDAVQVTEDNMVSVAEWCQGEVQQIDSNKGEASGNRFIKVRVHNPMTERQTKAFPGDWVLYAGKGYKVYTEKAFKNSFDEDMGATAPAVTEVHNVFQTNPSSAMFESPGVSVNNGGAGFPHV